MAPSGGNPASASEALRKLRKLVALARVQTYRAGLRHGVAAAVEHGCAPFEGDFATIIDVGAGRGQFALFARHRFPGAALYCFEPLPASRAKLADVMSEQPGVEVFETALGATKGNTTLHVSGDSDSSSLLAIGDQQLRFHPESGEVERVSVSVSRLDDVLGRRELAPPLLIKLDVQGYELEILRGAETILGQVSHVVAECSFMELYDGQPLADEVICHLRQRGFELSSSYSFALDASGRAVQADMLFTRPRGGPPSQGRP